LSILCVIQRILAKRSCAK